MSLSAIIINFNGAGDLPLCLKALANQTVPPEVIVVDNVSTDNSVSLLRRDWPDVIVVENPVNNGFGDGANTGAAVATGDVFLFMNPDVSLPPTAVEQITAAISERGGVIGPAIRTGATGDLDYGLTVDMLGMPKGLSSPGKPLFVQGCVLGVSRTAFDQLGHFDERYFLFAEDLELGWRAVAAGLECSVITDLIVDHRGGGSAAGGYASKNGFATSEIRVSLRERNTLAAVVSCAPASVTLIMVPILVTKIIAMAFLFAILGRRSLSAKLLQGLVWNGRELQRTLQRRRSLPRVKGGRKKAWRRVARTIFVFSTLRRFGMPRFVDTEVPVVLRDSVGRDDQVDKDEQYQ